MRNPQKDFYKKLLGKRGEITAAKFITANGLKIVQKNYKARAGEADIIALDANTLVFIEVKARSSEKYGLPCEAVNHAKQQRYREIAEEYIYKNSLDGIDVRFDVIEITGGRVNHIKNAFGC